MAPRKLTAERTKRITDAILAGARIEAAARHGGISPSTHFDWVAKGEAALNAADGDDTAIADDDARAHAGYANAIDAARREWELRQLALIQRAAVGQPWKTTETKVTVDADGNETTTTLVREGTNVSWQAAAWSLERRLPQEYARVTRTEVSGPEGQAIEMSMDDVVARGERAIDELRARRDRQAG